MDSGSEPEVLNAKMKKSHNYFKITMALRPPHSMVFPVYSGSIRTSITQAAFPRPRRQIHMRHTHDIVQDFKVATVHLLERFAQDAALSARKCESWVPIAGLVKETEPEKAAALANAIVAAVGADHVDKLDTVAPSTAYVACMTPSATGSDRAARPCRSHLAVDATCVDVTSILSLRSWTPWHRPPPTVTCMPHRSDPSTARAARPPTSGGGGAGEGDDVGAWATNAHAVRSPHRSDPSTARAARPPTSGGGGAGEGDDVGAWATNAHAVRSPPPIRPLDRAPPVHLRVAAVVPAKATTLVRGRRTRMLGGGGAGEGDDVGAWATNAHAVRSPHRSDPSTARAARPPTSGGGGAGEGDDVGAWATNAHAVRSPPTDPTPRPRAARPPTSGGGGAGEGDDVGAWATNAHAVRSPHRSDPSTARAARPPTSGGGGAGEGDDVGAWATNAHAVRSPHRSDPSTARRPSTYEWRRWCRRRRRLWCVGDERASTTRAPDGRIEGSLPRAHRPDTADTAAAPDTQDLTRITRKLSPPAPLKIPHLDSHSTLLAAYTACMTPSATWSGSSMSTRDPPTLRDFQSRVQQDFARPGTYPAMVLPQLALALFTHQGASHVNSNTGSSAPSVWLSLPAHPYLSLRIPTCIGSCGQALLL
ncbi:hypothetical protein BC826DRAFT_1110686 [Russula brevipes]|nr:hypothetical protein BC826DRAFT_1110686 [Russula brevipes]